MKLSIIVCVYNQEELVVRALDSIPRRGDVEVVIVNDGSSDNTRGVIDKYVADHGDLMFTVAHLEKNGGLGHAKNVAYSLCHGDYIGELDSDDYLYTEEYNNVIDGIDYDYDIIGYNLKSNDGTIFDLNEDTVHGLCAGILRMIKRDFMGDCRCPEIKAGEDWYLNEELMKKNPKIMYTHVIAYHYNFPREGSLFDLMVKGEL